MSSTQNSNSPTAPPALTAAPAPKPAPTVEQLIQQLPQDAQELLSERLRELGSLISLVSMVPDIQLRPNLPGTMWAFQFATKTVFAPLDELCNSDMDFCRGLTLHEAAHAIVTRAFDMLPEDAKKRAEVLSLLNVIEDCRIETWLQARQPGSAEWIVLYNQAIFGPMFSPPFPNCYAPQFLIAILSYWWTESPISGLAPPVLQAIEEAWPSVLEAVAAQPPRFMVAHPMVQQAYEQNRILRYTYGLSDRYSPPDDFECLVRIRQLQSLHKIFDGVLPIYERLLQQDREEGRGDELDEWIDTIDRPPGPPRPTTSGGQVYPSEEPCTPGQRAQQVGARASMEKGVAKAFMPKAKDDYMRVWSELSGPIDALADQLLRVFHARSRTRWLSGYPSGGRVDLRRAMGFEADPRSYNTLWDRKSDPHRVDPFFSMVVDISSSMGGERIKAVFDGLVLLAEVCTRLGVPFEVISFNTSAQLTYEHSDLLDEAGRLKLAQILHAPSGGTDFQCALRFARERLGRVAQHDKFMIFLSDGATSNEEEARAEIKRLRRGGVHTIGLGLGPETAELKRFFPEGLFELSTREFSRRFAGVVRRLLIGAVA